MALTKETTYDYEITGIGKNIQQKRKSLITDLEKHMHLIVQAMLLQKGKNHLKCGCFHTVIPKVTHKAI